MFLQTSKYQKCLEDITDAIDASISVSPPVPLLTTPALTSTYKLPEIKLPDIFGDIEAFPQFWELFSSLVGSRADLPVALKFMYLKNCLKGSSTKVLAGFPVDDHNYTQAKQLLQSTYKESECMQRKLILQLINIKSPGHNAKDLTKFRISFNQIIRFLGADNDVANSLWFIKKLLLSKVQKETKAFLLQREKSQYFSHDAFNEGFKVLIDLLETTLSQSPKREQTKQEDHTSKLTSGSSSSKSKLMMQTTTSASAASSSSADPSCFFCKESHFSSKCPTHVSPADRKNALYLNKRCVKCGGDKHYATYCNRRLPCYRCKGTHWTPLCSILDKFEKQKTSDPKSTNKAVSPSRSKKGDHRGKTEAESSPSLTSWKVTDNS